DRSRRVPPAWQDPEPDGGPHVQPSSFPRRLTPAAHRASTPPRQPAGPAPVAAGPPAGVPRATRLAHRAAAADRPPAAAGRRRVLVAARPPGPGLARWRAYRHGLGP